MRILITGGSGKAGNMSLLIHWSMAIRFFPGVPFTRDLDEHEALYSNMKIREVLGFKEQHNWTRYVSE